VRTASAKKRHCQEETGTPLTDTAFEVGDAVLGCRSRIDDEYRLLHGRRTESFVQVLHSDSRIRSPRGGRDTLTHSGRLAQRVGPAWPCGIPTGEEVLPARGCRRRRGRGGRRAASWTGRFASAHLDGSVGRRGKRRVQVQGRSSCVRVSWPSQLFPQAYVVLDSVSRAPAHLFRAGRASLRSPSRSQRRRTRSRRHLRRRRRPSRTGSTAHSRGLRAVLALCVPGRSGLRIARRRVAAAERGEVQREERCRRSKVRGCRRRRRSRSRGG
jgi:hypothetical protein